MKSLKTLILLLIIQPVSNINAQTKKGDIELDLGYGFVTIPQIASTATDIVTDLFTLGSHYTMNKEHLGAISLNPKYYISNKIAIGIEMSYETESKETWESKKGSDTRIGKAILRNYCIMPSVKFAYVNNDIMQVYSYLAGGYGRNEERFEYVEGNTSDSKKTEDFFALQLCFVGLRYGKNISLFAELGVGYTGILKTGLSFRL